jgi:hypothetical protein
MSPRTHWLQRGRAPATGLSQRGFDSHRNMYPSPHPMWCPSHIRPQSCRPDRRSPRICSMERWSSRSHTRTVSTIRSPRYVHPNDHLSVGAKECRARQSERDEHLPENGRHALESRRREIDDDTHCAHEHSRQRDRPGPHRYGIQSQSQQRYDCADREPVPRPSFAARRCRITFANCRGVFYPIRRSPAPAPRPDLPASLHRGVEVGSDLCFVLHLEERRCDPIPRRSAPAGLVVPDSCSLYAGGKPICT